MNDGMEQKLRSVMGGFGRLIERVIGQAQKAKAQVGGRGGVQPILSLESMVGTNKIRELIDVAMERVAVPAVPEIKGGVALDVGEGPPQFLSRFMDKGARVAIGLEVGGGSQGTQGSAEKGYIVRGKATAIPFNGDFFDYVSARMATPFQGDILRVVKEIARVVVPGGQGVLIDYHPYGLYAKKGPTRLRSAESSIRGAEDYYRVCRASGLRVVDLREAFVDENLRGFFSEDQMAAYRGMKGTPFVIFLFFYKPKQKK